jgi:hypothetical protein
VTPITLYKLGEGFGLSGPRPEGGIEMRRFWAAKLCTGVTGSLAPTGTTLGYMKR